MYHFKDSTGQSSDNTGYCKYCGRPLKNHGSINQKAGDVCISKHRRTRVRRIDLNRGEVVGFIEPERNKDTE